MIATTHDTNIKRSCNGCTACCVIYTVPEVNKPRHTPCQHLCAGGCAIHEQPRPPICSEFLCDWVTNAKWGEELRPDKCGIIYGTQSPLRANQPQKLIVGTMANPYAHLRKANKVHIERLSRAGHIVLLLYGDNEAEERHSHFDKKRYPSLTTEAILKVLKVARKERIAQTVEFYKEMERLGANA